jgi:hypothetical protein
MSNDQKYIRLYPERAVAPARKVLGEILAELKANGAHLDDVEHALTQLDALGFPKNEPLFLLRGQDVLAGELVHQYAQVVRHHPQPQVRALDADHIDELADRMDRWQPRKYPD